MIKVSIHQERIGFLNVLLPINRASKCMKTQYNKDVNHPQIDLQI